MKLPPDLEAKCLELAGQKPAPKARAAKSVLVEASHPSAGVWLVAYEAVNESNQRSWQGRNRRAGAAWKAVRSAFTLADLLPLELALRRGEPVRALFVRLGGKRLDPLVNLPASLKGLEDSVAYLLGVDDGSPLWRPYCGQEPGPGPVGVRVELSTHEERT